MSPTPPPAPISRASGHSLESSPGSYGHPLRFGLELSTSPPDGAGTESADQLKALVGLAVSAEKWGADIVALGDQPDGGIDALSLASWAAAHTSSAVVMPSRLAMDTRPASTTARALASLHLLSENRTALALTPAPGLGPAAVADLADAIEVIRALHDTNTAAATHHGQHHRVHQAEPGPTVERAVPLWLHGGHVDDHADHHLDQHVDSLFDAVDVASLAGRVADGWLMDLGSAQSPEAQLSTLTHAVDAAAIGAGRDPREIHRGILLSASSRSELPSVQDLIDLSVRYGISIFLLQVTLPNHHGQIQRAEAFLAEVAPAVRAGVDAALPPGTLTSRPFRRADVRAHRRPDIAYDQVPEDLAQSAVEPGDPAYPRVRSTYMRGGAPGLVLRPSTIDQVRSALAFARDHRHLPLGIRSGGHGISGRSTNHGGLIIDVGAFDEITVLDRDTRLVRIGPGARWRDVATALAPHGWALGSGDFGGVGVGGLATAGGIGFLSRKHGLTIDHLQALEMVLADGSLVRASHSENPELFWAARGAGANFGIATSFDFIVDEVQEVGWAQLTFQVADPAAYLMDFDAVMNDLPRETTPFLLLGQGMARLSAMVDSADPDVIVSQLQPFADIAPLVQQQVVIAPYAAVMNMFPEAPHDGRGEPVSRSVLVNAITPEFARASADLIASGASHWYQIRSVGGAVSDVPADATAYAHRDANYSLTVMGSSAAQVDRWFEPIRSHSDGLYLSFESDRNPARINDAFPPATLDRLRALKSQLDPDNLFADNFPLSAQPSTPTEPMRSHR